MHADGKAKTTTTKCATTYIVQTKTTNSNQALMKMKNPEEKTSKVDPTDRSSLTSTTAGANASAYNTKNQDTASATDILSRAKFKVQEERRLEQVAEAFQDFLHEQGLVQDFKSPLCPSLSVSTSAIRPTLMNKTHPRSFRGSDAVSVILRVLRQHQQSNPTNHPVMPLPEATRLEAVRVGRRMAAEFDFFRHVQATERSTIRNTAFWLVDSDQELYQFRNNLPSAVKAVKQQYPSLWDKMRWLEEHVVVRDRRHWFRMFPQCFVASEAIDVMMRGKLVTSRGEAVHLMRKLNVTVFCCHHVCHEHSFRDDYLFFEFVRPSERMPESVSVKGKKQPKSKSHTLPLNDSVMKDTSATTLPTTRSSSPKTVASSLSVDPRLRAQEVRRRLEAFRQEQAANPSTNVWGGPTTMGPQAA